jgi:hypothetical protein
MAVYREQATRQILSVTGNAFKFENLFTIRFGRGSTVTAENKRADNSALLSLSVTNLVASSSSTDAQANELHVPGSWPSGRSIRTMSRTDKQWRGNQ